MCVHGRDNTRSHNPKDCSTCTLVIAAAGTHLALAGKSVPGSSFKSVETWPKSQLPIAEQSQATYLYAAPPPLAAQAAAGHCINCMSVGLHELHLSDW